MATCQMWSMWRKRPPSPAVTALVYLVFLVDQADVDAAISDFRVHGNGARRRSCLPFKPPVAPQVRVALPWLLPSKAARSESLTWAGLIGVSR